MIWTWIILKWQISWEVKAKILRKTWNVNWLGISCLIILCNKLGLMLTLTPKQRLVQDQHSFVYGWNQRLHTCLESFCSCDTGKSKGSWDKILLHHNVRSHIRSFIRSWGILYCVHRVLRFTTFFTWNPA